MRKCNDHEIYSRRPIKFDLDLGELEQSFKNMQRKLHPDKFSISSEKEQEYSASQSSLINHAYQTLKNPRYRAEYMLDHVFNTNVDEYTLPQEFLLEMMELMEEISPDSDVPDAILLRRGAEIQQRMKQSQDLLAKSFAKQDVKEAQQHVAELNYLTRLYNTIHEQLP
jgi:molecular chaperone HscB